MSRREIPRLPDGSVDTSADLGDAFDDVMDTLHSTYAQPTHAPSAEELERAKRLESEYWESLLREVGQRVILTGIRALSHGEPPESQAEQFDRELVFVDGHGHRYDVLLPKSLTRDSFGLLDESMRLANVALITKSLLGAAAEYRRKRRQQ